jgi:alpha-mannosidase
MDERIIAKKLEILCSRKVVHRWPIEGWQVRLATYRAPGEYGDEGGWAPLDPHVGFPALKTVFLRAEADVPLASHRVYARFAFEGLEALLKVDGRPYAGLDRYHKRVPAPQPGSHVLEIEAMSMLRAYCQPELRDARGTFSGGAWIEVDERIEAIAYDLLFAWEALRVAGDERRRQRLAAVLERALLEIDLTLPDESLRQDLTRARRILVDGVGDIAPDPEGGRVYLVGHTHIDTAWLWPLSETVRKCGRTFATAVRLMEQYPGFHFSCSQAQLYAYTKDHHPALYDEIRKWVATGRWHTTGAMWVESDCNVPSGESLIRQFLYGLDFYRREFGTRPRTCWLPDVFGYPGSLPQILAGCGIPYFFTCKLHWQSSNPFPSHLFWWEGVDGSRVLAHIPRLRNYYNGTPNPEQLSIAWGNYAQKATYDEVMLPYGYGDGGGGVTPEMIEFAERARSYPGLPATRTGDEEAYYDDALQEGSNLPVWQGELYLETHRGTYTTQSRTKRANRLTEGALREAEIWGSIARSAGADVSLDPLGDAWRRMLTQQFHDILPGSSIGEVYQDALADYEHVRAVARQVRGASLRWLVDQRGPGGELYVFNALSWPRSDPVEAEIAYREGPYHLVDAAGGACPVQVIGRDGDRLRILFEPASVPSVGWSSYRLEPGEAAASLLIASERRLENAFYRLELDEEGAITSLIDKRLDREVIPQGERANVWQLFQDGPEREAAWNIHDTFEKRQYPFIEPARVSVVESGPVRAIVRVERTYRETSIRHDIMLYGRTPRVDFVADVDWQERQTMLKLAFPVAVRSPYATYEIQFGAVQRPTHRNTSWEQAKFEVAAHRWADLSEAGYGVSLLNDGRYGYDVRGNVLRLTALRGPEYPDPEADRGRHTFTYTLLPHLGNWGEGMTVRRARELNEPMVALSLDGRAAGEPSAHSCLQVVGHAGIVVETLKPAEDRDGWILRLYEAHGGRGTVRVSFDRPLARAVACNLVEEPLGEAPLHDGELRFVVRPFEIVSYRIWYAA